MIQVGDIVRTSYDQRPLVVIEVADGCRCPDYLAQIDCDGSPCDHERNCDEDCPMTRHDPTHLHLVCVLAEIHATGRWRKTDHRHYGGYAHKTEHLLHCIWQGGVTPSGNPDEIRILGHVAGSQLPLGLEA
ncbi:MAG TPA: hypothetical protein ENK43_00625 [Planctomycetes bacterium]|nr:hypothetical protein [Planctomycetota bacterium]